MNLLSSLMNHPPLFGGATLWWQMGKWAKVSDSFRSSRFCDSAMFDHFSTTLLFSPSLVENAKIVSTKCSFLNSQFFIPITYFCPPRLFLLFCEALNAGCRRPGKKFKRARLEVEKYYGYVNVYAGWLARNLPLWRCLRQFDSIRQIFLRRRSKMTVWRRENEIKLYKFLLIPWNRKAALPFGMAKGGKDWDWNWKKGKEGKL